MARGAVVVILSDGWERGDPALVGREMERLSRLAYRIVWVNPRAAAAGFAPRAGGMAAALPHCDALVSGHSLEALDEVVDAIGARRAGRRASRRPRRPPRPSPRRSPWPSATPVPGSSVAMPAATARAGAGRPRVGVGCTVSGAPAKICIYPGCERPAVPPHLLGGPQPSFCDLEEHNALTAHQERQRLARREANDSQGGSRRWRRGVPRGVPARAPDRQDGAQPDHRVRRQRGRLRPAGRRRARHPGARRQGGAGRHRPLRQRARLQHQPVETAPRRRSRARPSKILAKARLLAGMALEPRPRR